MPRRPRSIDPATTYHLVSRFVAREWFIATEDARQRYLHLLGRSLATSDWRCIAYAIMSNHIHLVLQAGETALAAWLSKVHGPYAEWVNRERERIGTVFMRPTTWAVHPGRVWAVVAYVHRNPVRAGVATDASASAWTSHRAYTGQADVPRWLDVDLGLQLTGCATGLQLAWFVDTIGADRADHEAALVKTPQAGRPFSAWPSLASSASPAPRPSSSRAALHP